MFALVLAFAASISDLARPLTLAEYHEVLARQVLTHKPIPPATIAYYHLKGAVLSALLRPGMTECEVRRVVGVRPTGWVQAGSVWEDHWHLLGLTVRFRLDGDSESPNPRIPLARGRRRAARRAVGYNPPRVPARAEVATAAA